VVSAQPWPATVAVPNAAVAAARPKSTTSSSTIEADLPPSSRNTLVTLADAAAITRRPVAVEPVKLTMSTRGSPVSSSPMAGSLDVTTLNTPAGMSVCSATNRPRARPHHGVSGAGFSTTVQPAASAGATLARLIWWGTFHGVMAATTPMGLRSVQRSAGPPRVSATPSGVVHS